MRISCWQLLILPLWLALCLPANAAESWYAGELVYGNSLRKATTKFVTISEGHTEGESYVLRLKTRQAKSNFRKVIVIRFTPTTAGKAQFISDERPLFKGEVQHRVEGETHHYEGSLSLDSEGTLYQLKASLGPTEVNYVGAIVHPDKSRTTTAFVLRPVSRPEYNLEILRANRLPGLPD